ncbi:hypothetical protein [Borrelia hermsii]|uniref:Uncharacterized protein n=3 Tax=Borrelia hermsii TaxID=140 RepID=A0AAN1CEL6_BORHE|nr:hypothetical protein [Borrelia hermsii]AAX17172.1 hypothetical protein BH0673 [Borrelia hermsii DAH]AJW73457.1 hypothetical protein L283_03375 [Borrelia hermsii CC1]AMR75191.1 hypothetical protein A0V01_00935 [Borrelia hermsii]ANA43471.1 hypothetical protein AXX13_03385 [Borrelia hermsii HS1]UCP01673.1 hypothetical protein K9R62_03425 [Borrelia hermsii]
MIKKIFLLLIINTSIYSRLITTSIEKRSSETTRQYSSFNLITEEAYYTQYPKNTHEIQIYELTENFIKSIFKDKIDYTAITPTYKEANQYLLQSEIIDKDFSKYKIFKIKTIDSIFKSSALIYTKKGFYKLELHMGNNNKNKLEIFNLNMSYFTKSPNEISNELIFYKNTK